MTRPRTILREIIIVESAGDKLIMTVQTGMYELRLAGYGTFSATW